ncbi:MAG: DNA polymerase III subunit beta, partial [Paludibacteraceae bacterium]|nr:DNA polymerase III subunit beta [Paludibacteraceae bacterium]
MKFNVSSSKLFSQLQAVSRVINSKNALPILDDVLFELVGNELKLTASDGETTVRTAIEVEGAEGGGKVASAAKLLLETLKEFSEQPLAFTIDEQNFAVNMVSQNGTYSFVGVNGNEYPEMPQDEVDAQELSLPATTLQSAIEKTIFCTADDPLRPVMNGIYID